MFLMCPRLSAWVGNGLQRKQKKIPAKKGGLGDGVSHGAQATERVSLSRFHGWIQRDGTESRSLAGDVGSAGAAASHEHRPHVVVTTVRCQ